MNKSYLMLSNNQKRDLILRAMPKFTHGKKFTAEDVAKRMKEMNPNIEFYGGLVMSIGGRLKGLGFHNTEERAANNMCYWVWQGADLTQPAPPEDDKTAPAPPDEKERIQAALLDTPETTPIEYVSSRAAASMERFLLTSEELAGIHQDAAPKDDPMRNYYKGRKVAFREALNIFLHLIK